MNFRKKHRSTAEDIELSEQARNRVNSTSNAPYFGGRRNQSSIPWWANDENLGVYGVGNSPDKSVFGGTRSDPGYVKRTIVASDATVSDHVIVDDDGNVISKNKNKNKNKKEKKVLWRQIRVTTLTESDVYFNDKNSTQPVAASTSSTVVIASSSSPSSSVAAVKDSTAASPSGPKVAPSSSTMVPNIHVRPQIYGGPLTVANYVVTSDRRPIAAASRPLNSSYRYTTTSNLTPAVWRRY